ncbi:ubiquinol oxidase subunit II [Acetobacter senegalensis]|uniref:ubiquinol oxidase subunit II n=1 Tax=Acetobacter senegalensis TaxID=446692 RepID=UPI00209D255E|nr:ubiquinol oxidase subunit II [Acetobacter senegalensis]MCP1197181.1 ubiquinol oxidase subunit II [Acetobacter senegalensis]
MSFRKSKNVLSILATLALSGCDSIELLNPKGSIGEQEKYLILLSMGVMLCVVIPVVGLSLYFAWHYRATNTKAYHDPTWHHSTVIEIVVWGIPIMIVAFLGWKIWVTTHELDPYKELASTAPAVEVEVVALNWKWLFIYPQYGIATVNLLHIPVDRPINFHLTSDSNMNSFFIPQLGSQIYAMAGMETQLHLQGTQVGTYIGRSTAFSGPGFSGMKFPTRVESEDQFKEWVKEAHSNFNVLDDNSYLQLRKDSEDNPEAIYGSVTPRLFEEITTQYDCSRKNSLWRNGDVSHCTEVGSVVMENH